MPTAAKRPRPCAATTPANNATVDDGNPPEEQHERERAVAGGCIVIVPRPSKEPAVAAILDSRHCDECHQTLPRNLFPKDKFAKNGGNSDGTRKVDDGIISVRHVCRRCKKNMTAVRCGQPIKSQMMVGRVSASGNKRRPNNHGYCDYVDDLFSLDCFPHIISLGAFTSAKDVSESMAAIKAARKHGRLSSSSSSKEKEKETNVICLCIGDGCTPRTAILACFIEKNWDCVSIDPALRDEWHGDAPNGVRGLVGYGGTLEDYMTIRDDHEGEGGVVVGKTKRYDRLLLLCVHSHARLVGHASVRSIMTRYGDVPTTLISLPCCPKFRSSKDVGRVPDVHYEDDCVFSACRRVEIWNFN